MVWLISQELETLTQENFRQERKRPGFLNGGARLLPCTLCPIPTYPHTLAKSCVALLHSNSVLRPCAMQCVKIQWFGVDKKFSDTLIHSGNQLLRKGHVGIQFDIRGSARGRAQSSLQGPVILRQECSRKAKRSFVTAAKFFCVTHLWQMIRALVTASRHCATSLLT